MNEELIEYREEVKDQIDYFTDKFSEWYGTGHLILAQHAAFPVSITADLLYQIWANFKNYKDEDENGNVIPMLAVSDLLLSSLFRQTSRDIFEMQPEVRAYLINELKQDPRFGAERIRQLAIFLYQYVTEQPDRPEWKNFKQAQKWAAILAVDPAGAAKDILQALVEKISNTQVNSSIGIANMIEALAKDNNEFTRAVSERLAPAASIGAEPVNSGSKSLVLAEQAKPGSIPFPINLPVHISTRLSAIKKNTTIEPVLPRKKNRIVFGLFVGIGDYHIGEFSYKNSKAYLPINHSDTDVLAISNCLTDLNLLETTHIKMLTNEHATKINFINELTSILAGCHSDDIVIIYFSGHSSNRLGEKESILFHPEKDSNPEYIFDESINLSPLEFRGIISAFSKSGPSLIFIIDSHAGGREWLEENNPKHFLMMATHSGESAIEIDGVGFFANSLIEILHTSSGKISYRHLYREMVLKHSSKELTPLFQTSLWNTLVFTNEVPMADSIINSISMGLLAKYNIHDDGKMLFYLDFKKKLRESDKINILVVADHINKQIESIYEDKNFHIDHHLFGNIEMTPKGIYKRVNSLGTDFKKKLIECNSIVFFMGREGNLKYDQSTDILLDMAFALGKEVILITENHSRSIQLERRYSSIIWKSVAGNMAENQTIILDRLNEYKKFLLQIKDDISEITNSEIPDDGIFNLASKTGNLDLSGRMLKAIPRQVFELRNLKELNLLGNNIHYLPDEIAKLQHLEVLNLNGNPIEKFPRVILELKKLAVLALSNTNLQEIPADIVNLTFLKELYVHEANLVMLPEVISELNLAVLDARKNNLLNIPDKVIYNKNAQTRLRDYVATFTPASGPKVKIIVLCDKKATVRQLTGLLSKTIKRDLWDVVEGVVSPDTFYKAMKNHIAEGCVVYFEGPENFFRQFERPDKAKIIHNISKFIQALGTIQLNFIFAGPEIDRPLLNGLRKIEEINFIVLISKEVAGTKIGNDFISHYFENYSKGVAAFNCYRLAEKKYGSIIHQNKLYFDFYKSSRYIDTQLKVTDIIDEKKKTKIVDVVDARIEDAKITKALSLSGLGLKTIPPAVFLLKNLQHLDISNNEITEIPSAISKLTLLKELLATGTKVTYMPVHFFELKNLQRLFLDNTLLEDLPYSFTKLTKLESLSFEDTSIKVIPPFLISLPKLNHLRARHNKILNIPQHVLAGFTMDGIKKYFSFRKLAGKTPCILYIRSGFRYTILSKALEKLELPARQSASTFKYISITNCKTLNQLAELILKNSNEKTLIIIDDEEGLLLNQFGKAAAAKLTIKQYFNSFFFPLNLIYNGPLNSGDAFVDFIDSKGANSLVLKNNTKGEVLFPAFLLEQAIKTGLSWHEVLSFVNKLFLKKQERNFFKTIGFDLYYTSQELRDFSFIRKKTSITEIVKLILRSKFLSVLAKGTNVSINDIFKSLSTPIDKEKAVSTKKTSSRSSKRRPLKKASRKK